MTLSILRPGSRSARAAEDRGNQTRIDIEFSGDVDAVKAGAGLAESGRSAAESRARAAGQAGATAPSTPAAGRSSRGGSCDGRAQGLNRRLVELDVGGDLVEQGDDLASAIALPSLCSSRVSRSASALWVLLACAPCATCISACCEGMPTGRAAARRSSGTTSTMGLLAATTVAVPGSQSRMSSGSRSVFGKNGCGGSKARASIGCTGSLSNTCSVCDASSHDRHHRAATPSRRARRPMQTMRGAGAVISLPTVPATQGRNHATMIRIEK